MLLIVADDLGTDALNGYETTALRPITPVLDGLRADGLTFLNAWAAPKCTPSRGAILSGKYGVKTGVTGTPGNLDPTQHVSLFRALASQTGNAYADALIGKWHLSSPQDVSQISAHGVDYFAGFLNAMVGDYFDWTEIELDGSTTPVTDYATSHFTDRALSWINARSQPWFLTLSHAAPHSPFHEPPAALLNTPYSDASNRHKFVAAVEAMDTEIGRLLDGIPTAVLNNTLIIFLGDNGSPNGVLEVFPRQHGKNSIYEGGVNVPLIVAGAGVSRSGETEVPGISTTNTPPATPFLAGWASDGFPILYRFGPAAVGGLAELQPSYRLKAGERPGDGVSAPCGPYSGKYTNDYEYVAGLGDLDECNGVARSVTVITPQGTETFGYFYVVTAAFPQIGRCLMGTPDGSFRGRDNPGSSEPLLPLDLLDFRAAAPAGKLNVDLKWTTANETGVGYFAVERGTDGLAFTEVGRLAATNGSGQQVYALTDEVGTAGRYYYRLRMVDLDGSLAYSPVRQVTLAKAALELAVRPNPTTDRVGWTLAEAATAGGTAEVLGPDGRLLDRRAFLAGAAAAERTFSLAAYPPGVYLVRVTVAGQRGVTRRVVKR